MPGFSGGANCHSPCGCTIRYVSQFPQQTSLLKESPDCLRHVDRTATSWRVYSPGASVACSRLCGEVTVQCCRPQKHFTVCRNTLFAVSWGTYNILSIPRMTTHPNVAELPSPWIIAVMSRKEKYLRSYVCKRLVFLT